MLGVAALKAGLERHAHRGNWGVCLQAMMVWCCCVTAQLFVSRLTDSTTNAKLSCSGIGTCHLGSSRPVDRPAASLPDLQPVTPVTAPHWACQPEMYIVLWQSSYERCKFMFPRVSNFELSALPSGSSRLVQPRQAAATCTCLVGARGGRMTAQYWC